MLLGDLVTAIQTVKDRIREHGNSLSQNEYRTRISLIDPILNALGWDVSDPKLVTPEYPVDDRERVDYALLIKDEETKSFVPKAFIEAKSLGTGLDNTKPETQVLNYARKKGIRFIGLTNGERWIFEDYAAGFFSGEGKLLDVKISEEDAHRCALRFLLLWRWTLGAKGPVQAKEPVVVPLPEPDPIIISQGWMSLAEYDPNSGKPIKIRLPETQETPILNWHEILGQTAQWLIDKGKLTKSMCPIKAIVNSEPRSEGGAQFRQFGELTKGLVFNKHGSRQDTLARTKYLARHCGLDPASILLKPSE